MKSLFLRMFLWFCSVTAVVVIGVVAGFELSNPDQLPFAWPRVGQGAILSAGRVAVGAYERGGDAELTAYLESLGHDTGIRGTLFDEAGRSLGGVAPALQLSHELAEQAEGQLLFRLRNHLAGVRLPGRGGHWYAFVAHVPRREVGGFWSRTFVVSLLLSGSVLCYLLARHVTAPVVQLRALTSRFSDGDLTQRLTSPGILGRKDEIGGLARDFNHMASRMETLVTAQQRLIGDVSHELRSPLTRLSLALGLIRRRLGPESRTSLARIEREVERLNALITQLLTLSRLEGLDRQPPMQSIDLSALLQEIAADADFEATRIDRGVRLLECARCSTRGAVDLLRSAVENVVRNALKYTSPDTQVSIRLLKDQANDEAMIVVEDEGPGVPPEALEEMFKPFYRVDEARDRRSGGAGLGLAITRQIVALHGGSVRAANRVAGGLEMRITLPLIDGSST